MADLAVLRPFEQYFSHIRKTMAVNCSKRSIYVKVQGVSEAKVG